MLNQKWTIANYFLLFPLIFKFSFFYSWCHDIYLTLSTMVSKLQRKQKCRWPVLTHLPKSREKCTKGPLIFLLDTPEPMDQCVKTVSPDVCPGARGDSPFLTDSRSRWPVRRSFLSSQILRDTMAWKVILYISLLQCIFVNSLLISTPFDNFRIECPQKSGVQRLSIRMAESEGRLRQDTVFALSCNPISEV